MRTFAFLLVLIFAANGVAAPVPTPTVREAEKLIDKLGSDTYSEREAASSRLEVLGELALDALRAATKSENPEIAQRATILLRKVEFRVASDTLLKPALVELNAKDAVLDDVLAELSKQAGYEVVIGGSKRQETAAKRITVTTDGKVPFWNAVLKVCDAGELYLAGSGGFFVSGAMPYGQYGIRGGGPGIAQKYRVASGPDLAVILEALDGKKRRPVSVHGGILIETLPPPRSLTPCTVFQIWPEPKIVWRSVSNVMVQRAINSDGSKLTRDFSRERPPPQFGKMKDGDEKVMREYEKLKGNLRQATVKFKGGNDPEQARELTGVMFGVVQGVPEPLATIELHPKQAITATGETGVQMKASPVRADENGKQFLDVELTFPQSEVNAVQAKDRLPDVKQSAAGGNDSLFGVRVTNADGAAFSLSLKNHRTGRLRSGDSGVVYLTLEVVIAKDGPTIPAKITFWGTISKPVEVPFALKNVPLK